MIERGAAPAFGNDDAERAQLTELLQRLARKAMLSIPRGRLRCELLAREGAERVADLPLLVG